MSTDYAHQHQEFTDAHGDPVGDCFRTALACLLEVDRSEVPHFAEIYKDSEGLDWWYHAIWFVENRLPGWTLICVRPIYPVYEAESDFPERVILTGDSPRGPWGHSVLVHSATGALEWDPFPTGQGVGLPRDVIALTNKTEVNYVWSWTPDQGLVDHSVDRAGNERSDDAAVL